METKFQTSFIPKKPMISIGGATLPKHRRGGSLFMTLATVLFIASIAAGGGVYAWKAYSLNMQDTYKQQLSERERQFNADLIEELKRQNVRIDLSKTLLANHLAVSQVFDIIGRMTIESVQFLNLELHSADASNGDIQISMSGIGAGFSSVAFQSDVLGTLERYGLRRIIKNPILSDPALDSSNEVSFGFSASIDPADLSYNNLLQQEAAASSSTPPTP